MKTRETVAVILATYNGEKYLEDQIGSILNQKDVSVQIFARDDGSADQTLKILKKFANNYPNFHLLNNGITENKGIREGFIEILKWAISYPDNFTYFAFSDQDDFWLPEKLISAINEIKKSNNANGALYYSNKTIVDENLKVRYTENFTIYNDFSDFYFVSNAYGCTMVIDRKLAILSTKFVSTYSHFHDDWIHRLAICLGTDIIFDNNSYILYRQHNSNFCGTFATGDKSIGHLVKRTFDFISKGGGYNRAELAKDILKNYNTLISIDIKEKIKIVCIYKSSFKNKILLLKKADVKKRTHKEKIIWGIKVFIGYF